MGLDSVGIDLTAAALVDARSRSTTSTAAGAADLPHPVHTPTEVLGERIGSRLDLRLTLPAAY
ncbi:hypothetical protein [Modestobacter sp. I12A-02662]|uniref:hypothetical protein n=1 Tax=Modestobacter sp. I12A-02662 TaxID=1730496 RepID=UPI0034DE9622